MCVCVCGGSLPLTVRVSHHLFRPPVAKKQSGLCVGNLHTRALRCLPEVIIRQRANIFENLQDSI